jgi:hypothetical protein
MPEDETTTLFRPVGQAELDLIFYPVLDEEYAVLSEFNRQIMGTIEVVAEFRRSGEPTGSSPAGSH